MLLSCFKIQYALVGLIFEDAYCSVDSSSVQLAVNRLMEKGSIFKKQCKYLPSAMVQ